MTKVYSKALDKTIQVDRIIGHIAGSQPGPTVVFIGGIHGNEPSGIFALHRIIDHLKDKRNTISGDIYAISGNLLALSRGERFLKYDLNRVWTKQCLENISTHEDGKTDKDLKELARIHELTMSILSKHSSPFYFIDLHSTSGETTPFITLNDTLTNRKFSLGFPVPVILGIEEFIEGPYLSYVNELGYVALGFESGQHDEIASIKNHESFIYLTLEHTGTMKKTDISGYDNYYELLAERADYSQKFFEIRDRYKIEENEIFQMNEGYVNFQTIAKGDHLARSNGVDVPANYSGKIFLPIYQEKGEDGFFIVRKIPNVVLKLSSFLRKINFDNVLPFLPGIRWASSKKNILRVNKKTARLFARDFFHLLGYRSKVFRENYLMVRNREKNFRENDYAREKWNYLSKR